MSARLYEDARKAIGDVRDGATVLIGGFGPAGQPIQLIGALMDRAARDLTVVSNNAGNGHAGLAALLEARPPAPSPRSTRSSAQENSIPRAS